MKLFKKGFQLYIDGKWADAKQYLEQVEVHKGMEDNPSACLLVNMEKENFQAPPTWKGYRVLTSK